MCGEIGSKPLIGVNYLCSSKHEAYCGMIRACVASLSCYVADQRYFAGTVNQSIAHAVKQVEFVVSKGFPAAFYYIVRQQGVNLRAHTYALTTVDWC